MNCGALTVTLKSPATAPTPTVFQECVTRMRMRDTDTVAQFVGGHADATDYYIILTRRQRPDWYHCGQ